MGIADDLINNFGGDNSQSFKSIIGDVAPPNLLWNVRVRVNKLTKWQFKIEELEKIAKPTGLNKAKIQYYNSRINNTLPILIKEVTNAREEGYTITLPAMWEHKI